MRSFMQIVENAQGVAAEFQGVELPRIILKAGTILYHGTSRPMEEWNPHEEAPFSPAWFGLDYRIAAGNEVMIGDTEALTFIKAEEALR